jgi:outer membrane receptor protein involved in Fe transport
MADPDRFYLPTLRVEYDLGRLKVISNTSYYDRLERVNGYSGTLYNLSFFQHFLSSDPSINQYGNDFPTDPQGVACTNGCGSFFPLLTPTGPNVPGLSNYYSQNLITNAQQNFTQEIRVQSDAFSSRLQWTAGFFYSFNRQQSKEEIRDPMLPQLTQLLWGEDMITAWGEDLLANGDDYINNTRAHDRQEALFADATYAITERLKLNIGLRYAWTKFVFANTNDGAQDLLGGPPSFDNGGLAGGGKSEQPFTPKFSLSYQLTPDDLVYATASKGYRIGGATPPLPPNCGTGFPTSYNSDSLWSYEVGTKDRFLDRTLQVSASAFYVDWSNIQQAFYVPVCGIQFTTNAGEAISKGFDLQSQWQVTRALDLELSVGYTDARFSKTALDANGDVLNVKGDALDLAPWTVTVAAQYAFTVMGREGFLRADYEFASKRTAPIPNEDPATAFYDPGLVPNPATHQVSMRAGVTIGAWDLALYANNLLNAHPVLNLTHQDSATTLYEATTLRPRTIGMAATFKY